MPVKNHFPQVFILLILLQLNSSLIPACFAQEKSHEDITGNDLKIWLTRPATEWENALPVGNGRLGAMIFGGIEKERIQLNEESLWAGRELDYHNPRSLEGLIEVRRLLFEGRFVEAEKTAQEKIMGDKKNDETHSYQTLGDLILDFGRYRGKGDYRRELDIETAIATVTYQANWTQYTREIFSSAPDQVLVVRLSAGRSNDISLTVRLSRPGNRAKIETGGNDMIMSEHTGNGIGVKMVTRLKAVPEGGTLVSGGDSIRIGNANSVVLLLTAATDYHGGDPGDISAKQMELASSKSYDELKKSHITDYRQYFKRVDLNIGSTDAVYFPTDARIDAMKNGYVDPQLMELYFQFGRYLLISSSRPGCLPANLQGIWADGLTLPWSADYHININIQMNYWPAEVTNLSELHMPFLEFINDLSEDGRKSARDVYGCKGIVAHYTTDPWHFTEPTGMIGYGMWPMGINWSCRHLWEHYLYTGDKAWLDTFAYPIMKEASEFCMDWLVKDPKTGRLVSGPSISPENRFLTSDGQKASMNMGPTMDQMIIWDLLNYTIRTSGIIGRDDAFRNEMIKTLENLSPVRIGSDGRLMEWTEEFEEAEPGHRHISHLYGLHPGSQITKQKNPEFLEAARKTIEHRLSHGGGHTGWSRAWIINFFARLQDGEAAYDNILALLRKSTLHNLFDTHPPFQIDGNFGATAGIAEMLLQSHAGEIHLLPALPSAWKNGYIHGLCARGGFEVDIDWEEGKLKKAVVLSKLGNDCQIRYGEKVTSITTIEGRRYEFNSKLEMR
ncbi:MAG: glycoside hydrolase family 95 protein [Bacteroidales bacterium]|nr:glycoside hydrolase family 95 protein [Bacteroidales bacterium]